MSGTYYGTTAGSTLQNPPVLIAQAMAGSIGNAPFMIGAGLWFYTSTNYSTDIQNSGTPLITDGQVLGMKRGDVLMSVASVSTSDIIPVLALDVIVSVSTAGVFTSTNRITSTME